MTLFFRLNGWALGAIIFAVILGSTALGLALGRWLRHRSDVLREPFAVLHSALLGMMALVLAFGLALAMGRYESRRAALVDETNAIGTTYLRAQTLSEPVRTSSLDLLKDYTDTSIALSQTVPGSADEDATVAAGQKIQRELWGLADDALNEMIDMQTTRVATRGNRVPTPILAVELFGAAVALGLLSFYLSMIGRGIYAVVLAAVLVSFLILVTFDLDRPTRGLIRVPDTALVELRASMELPPAAS
jgi:hypothetical protein